MRWARCSVKSTARRSLRAVRRFALTTAPLGVRALASVTARRSPFLVKYVRHTAQSGDRGSVLPFAGLMLFSFVGWYRAEFSHTSQQIRNTFLRGQVSEHSHRIYLR
jgi:hypothetical protein